MCATVYQHCVVYLCCRLCSKKTWFLCSYVMLKHGVYNQLCYKEVACCTDKLKLRISCTSYELHPTANKQLNNTYIYIQSYVSMYSIWTVCVPCMYLHTPCMQSCVFEVVCAVYTLHQYCTLVSNIIFIHCMYVMYNYINNIIIILKYFTAIV